MKMNLIPRFCKLKRNVDSHKPAAYNKCNTVGCGGQCFGSTGSKLDDAKRTAQNIFCQKQQKDKGDLNEGAETLWDGFNAMVGK